MKTLTTVVAVVTFLGCGPSRAHGRLVEISVYDRAEGRWLQVYRHEGRAHIVGKPGWRKSLSETAAFHFT